MPLVSQRTFTISAEALSARATRPPRQRTLPGSTHRVRFACRLWSKPPSGGGQASREPPADPAPSLTTLPHPQRGVHPTRLGRRRRRPTQRASSSAALGLPVQPTRWSVRAATRHRPWAAAARAVPRLLLLDRGGPVAPRLWDSCVSAWTAGVVTGVCGVRGKTERRHPVATDVSACGPLARPAYGPRTCTNATSGGAASQFFRTGTALSCLSDRPRAARAPETTAPAVVCDTCRTHRRRSEVGAPAPPASSPTCSPAFVPPHGSKIASIRVATAATSVAVVKVMGVVA